MASRNYNKALVHAPGTVVVAGSFAPNGSSAVSAASRKGRGWSVARTSAGLFTITLTQKYNQLLSATATLQLATAADQYAQVGETSMSARTIQIRVWDESEGAVADVAADANNRINFILVLSNTSALPIAGL